MCKLSPQAPNECAPPLALPLSHSLSVSRQVKQKFFNKMFAFASAKVWCGKKMRVPAATESASKTEWKPEQALPLPASLSLPASLLGSRPERRPAKR